MGDQTTKAIEHIFYEMNRTVYFALYSANKTTIPSPSVVLKFPLIQKVCHLYLLQGSDCF